MSSTDKRRSAPGWGLMLAGGLLLATALACECGQDVSDAPFPRPMAEALLDQPSSEAPAIIASYYPGSRARSGALDIHTISGSSWLDEVILFSDVRSGRINSVVLKYAPSLTQEQRATIYADVGVPQLAERLESRDVVEEAVGPRTLRVRRADKQGKLTITVE